MQELWKRSVLVKKGSYLFARRSLLTAKDPTTVFTAWHSYASVVLGVVILSVCHTHALWLIQRTYRRYFYTTWKGNPSSQVWFSIQLCSSWQDFNWLKASRGPSAIAELLVVSCRRELWDSGACVCCQVFCCMVRLALARRCWLEPVLPRPSRHSWSWLDRSWSRCSSAMVRSSSEMHSLWPRRRRRQSSSLMNLMPSVT